jgi:hypothetical protein
MARIDHSAAECLVFTYREGPLSALGHDLMLRVTRFEVDVTPVTHAIEARFDASSLRVVAGSRGSALHDGALDEHDRRKIEKSIRDEVLHAHLHPSILFRSTEVLRAGSGHDVTGELTLHGVTRTITLQSRLEGGRQTAELTLHQPDYGIRPYTAFLGALRVKPSVTVRIRIQEP